MTRKARASDNVNVGVATFVTKSSNKKIASAKGFGEVSTTYVSIKVSCPNSCAMKADGSCYAQNGHVGMVVRRLDKRADSELAFTAGDAADDEAESMDRAFLGGEVPQDGAKGGRDLRIHTSGDCRTAAAANTVGSAAERWKARKGGDAWTYTHAWKDVKRVSWGPAISVLASVDDSKPETLQAARSQGYAPARVVTRHPADGRSFADAGVLWTPCPAQTRENVGCADCRLCFNADRLHAQNRGIQFAAHGAGTTKIVRRLSVVA